MANEQGAREEARRLLEQITPGPWAWEPIAEKSNEWAVGQAWDRDGNPIEGRIPEGEELTDTIIERRLIGMNESGHANFADAEFIAAAPRLLRALLSESPQGVRELIAALSKEAKSHEQGIVAYVQWFGGIHDDGCPEDDTCDCSGAPVNKGVTAACEFLLTLGAQLEALLGASEPLRHPTNQEDGLRGSEPTYSGEPTPVAAHVQCHDSVCNASRTHPRGARQVGCSCRYRDAVAVEQCICAAIKLPNGEVWRGHRHDSAILTAGRAGVDQESIYAAEQGFITSRNRFVSREEGAIIQNTAGVRSASHGGQISGMLFSEDLYLRSWRDRSIGVDGGEPTISSEESKPANPESSSALLRAEVSEAHREIQGLRDRKLGGDPSAPPSTPSDR